MTEYEKCFDDSLLYFGRIPAKCQWPVDQCFDTAWL
jgi:hypothetical protein